MRNKKITVIVICIFCLIILTGCSNDQSAEDTKSKISQELDYLDTQIVGILNKLNNISLQNYEITSEEITLKENSTSGSQGGGSSTGGSSSQEETGMRRSAKRIK